MKVKLSQIINSQEGIKALMDCKLPINVSYSLGKLVYKMQPDLQSYDTARLKLLEEVGKKNDKNGNYDVDPDKVKFFQEELTKLLNVEVELKFNESSDFPKIKVSELGEFTLEPKYLVMLDWLLEN